MSAASQIYRFSQLRTKFWEAEPRFSITDFEAQEYKLASLLRKKDFKCEWCGQHQTHLQMGHDYHPAMQITLRSFFFSPHAPKESYVACYDCWWPYRPIGEGDD